MPRLTYNRPFERCTALFRAGYARNTREMRAPEPFKASEGPLARMYAHILPRGRSADLAPALTCIATRYTASVVHL